MTSIEVINGSIDGIALRNIEMNFSDKAVNLSEKEYAYRGSHLMLLSGAKNVTMENFHIAGSLYGAEEPIHIENCEGLEKRNCNF